MGRRQHYIPRVLLRRFASRTVEDSDKAFIWQIAKARQPKEISIRDVAVGDYFYGLDGDLEEQFSTMEGELGQVLKSIEDGIDPQVHAGSLRRFVWMQVMRTRAMKDQLSAVWRSAMTEFKRSAESVDLIPRLTQEVILRFDELAEAHLKQLPLADQIVFRNMLSVPHFREMTLKTMTHKMVTADIASVLARMMALLAEEGTVRDTVEKGMNRGLTGLFSESEFVPNFDPAFWSLKEAIPHTFVLGDMCVFAVNSDGSTGSIHRLADSWEHVLFPIAHSRLLVASRVEGDLPIDFQKVNLASAQLSTNVLLASSNSHSELGAHIGSCEYFFSQAEIEAVVSEVWKEKG